MLKYGKTARKIPQRPSFQILARRCVTMDQKELEYLRHVEDHAAQTGWVAPLTQEDKEYFAYLRQVGKRYNICPKQTDWSMIL